MGNCCKPASSMEWGGEEWEDCLKSENNRKRSSSKVVDESQGLSLGNVKKENLSEVLRASCDANGRVKIMISKKELGELVGEIEKQNDMKKKKKKQVGQSTCSAEQVLLLRLIKAREHAKQHHDFHHRPWRPVLHTILELNY